ncbi:MAG: hypothetical protein KKE44_02795 [Proteobacteria bacterium]|nr:hypothetical protein [Pseudomonadota bacterium]MBU1581654.1 hypothetical protein [Pseudomonadota bacterium]MBU2629314.1 hypothetical protein [Pseudomonadota bacterium]
MKKRTLEGIVINWKKMGIITEINLSIGFKPVQRVARKFGVEKAYILGPS